MDQKELNQQPRPDTEPAQPIENKDKNEGLIEHVISQPSTSLDQAEYRPPIQPFEMPSPNTSSLEQNQNPPGIPNGEVIPPEKRIEALRALLNGRKPESGGSSEDKYFNMTNELADYQQATQKENDQNLSK
jgi:hypothetical protein